MRRRFYVEPEGYQVSNRQMRPVEGDRETPLPENPADCYRPPFRKTVAGEEIRMTPPIILGTSRRRFLQYLAGSPLLASGAISAYGMEVPSKLPDPMIWAPADGELIKSPKDAINVFDFEPVA
jgi:hypothetical protein